MFCCNCKRELAPGTGFCIYCGAEQPAAPYPQQAPVQPTLQYTVAPGRAPKDSKGRYMLFGACGTAVGAILLAVILLAAGVFSTVGKTIEGPGYATPEDAAKAYLTGLRDGDLDAMLSSFAIETYVDNYDFEAFIERLSAYNFNSEMRFPDTNNYTRQLNIESRRDRITNQIIIQYMFHNAPGALNNGAIVVLDNPDKISDFVSDFERDTKDYVFQDLKVLTVLSSQDLKEGRSPEDLAEDLLKEVENDLPEDLLDELSEGMLENVIDIYMNERNQENIAKQAEPYGAGIEDVANIVVIFEAGGDTWLFCPQSIRFNGRWYLQTLQGNLAILLGLSTFTGGMVSID